MSDILRKCIPGILALILSCSTADEKKSYTDFKFSSSFKKTTTFKSKKRIAVQTFIDEREKENISYSSLLLIPLVPYANEYYNKPELTHDYNMKFLIETDLAKAMKTELLSYSVFENVFYTDRTFPKDADYLILVRIKQNQIHTKRSLYGVNTLPLATTEPFTYYFLYLFLELEYYGIKLDFELELLDLKTKEITFQKKFHKGNEGWELGNNLRSINTFRSRLLSMNEEIIYAMSEEIIQYFKENKK